MYDQFKPVGLGGVFNFYLFKKILLALMQIEMNENDKELF